MGKNNEGYNKGLKTHLLYSLQKDKGVDDIYKLLTDIKTLAEQRKSKSKSSYKNMVQIYAIEKSIKNTCYSSNTKTQMLFTISILDLISKDFYLV